MSEHATNNNAKPAPPLILAAGRYPKRFSISFQGESPQPTQDDYRYIQTDSSSLSGRDLNSAKVTSTPSTCATSSTPSTPSVYPSRPESGRSDVKRTQVDMACPNEIHNETNTLDDNVDIRTLWTRNVHNATPSWEEFEI